MNILGKWWGARDRQPVLALHGWQDNAGTFDRLCPMLPPQIPILCIDLPGHGKSSQYPTGVQYYLFWDGINFIRRIVKHFGWESVTLLGHSLGGALSFMYAACFPQETTKFISLDIPGPTVRDAKRIASLTGHNIDQFLKYESFPSENMPCYEYSDMVDIVYDAHRGSITRESAKVLLRRGVVEAIKEPNKPSQYHFARDLRLKVALMGMLSLEHTLAYAEQIKCRVLNIRAIPGMTFDNPKVYPMVIDTLRKNCKEVIYKEVEGTHHVHLNNPERIAKYISDFLLH